MIGLTPEFHQIWVRCVSDQSQQVSLCVLPLPLAPLIAYPPRCSSNPSTADTQGCPARAALKMEPVGVDGWGPPWLRVYLRGNFLLSKIWNHILFDLHSVPKHCCWPSDSPSLSNGNFPQREKNKHPRHMTGTFWSCKPLETWREEAVDLCGMKTDFGFSRWHGPGSLWKAHQLLVQSGPEGRADHTLTPATSTTLYVQYMSPTRASHPLILIALDVFLPIFSSCRDKKAFFKFSQLPPPTGFFSSSLSISLLSQRASPCNC